MTDCGDVLGCSVSFVSQSLSPKELGRVAAAKRATMLLGVLRVGAHVCCQQGLLRLELPVCRPCCMPEHIGWPLHLDIVAAIQLLRVALVS